jgi:hypothetical protein
MTKQFRLIPLALRGTVREHQAIQAHQILLCRKCEYSRHLSAQYSAAMPLMPEIFVFKDDDLIQRVYSGTLTDLNPNLPHGIIKSGNEIETLAAINNVQCGNRNETAPPITAVVKFKPHSLGSSRQINVARIKFRHRELSKILRGEILS